MINERQAIFAASLAMLFWLLPFIAVNVIDFYSFPVPEIVVTAIRIWTCVAVPLLPIIGIGIVWLAWHTGRPDAKTLKPPKK